MGAFKFSLNLNLTRRRNRVCNAMLDRYNRSEWTLSLAEDVTAAAEKNLKPAVGYLGSAAYDAIQ